MKSVMKACGMIPPLKQTKPIWLCQGIGRSYDTKSVGKKIKNSGWGDKLVVDCIWRKTPGWNFRFWMSASEGNLFQVAMVTGDDYAGLFWVNAVKYCLEKAFNRGKHRPGFLNLASVTDQVRDLILVKRKLMLAGE